MTAGSRDALVWGRGLTVVSRQTLRGVGGSNICWTPVVETKIQGFLSTASGFFAAFEDASRTCLGFPGVGTHHTEPFPLFRLLPCLVSVGLPSEAIKQNLIISYRAQHKS